MSAIEDAAISGCRDCLNCTVQVRGRLAEIQRLARMASRTRSGRALTRHLADVATSKANLTNERAVLADHLRRDHEVTP